MQTSAAGTQLPGLVTTTYTVVCDEKGLFKRQTATEQMTRKPAPPPDEFSFQALLANIIKVTLGRSLALQQPRKLERRATQLHLKPVLNVSAIDSDLPRNRDIKSARVEVQLYIPRNEEAKTKGKRTHSKLNMVIKECNEVQESLMPIWQMASSTVTTKRKELGETKQVLQTATEELNIWRTNTLYRSGKEALERRMKDRESKLEREDRALLSHLLGVKSQPCSPVSSDLASIRSLRFAQKLRRHKRGFGKGFGEVMEARASAPASPAREWKGFKGETEEQALLREIRHYRMSEIQLSGDEKVVSPPRTEAPSPTGELLSPADAVNDLNKFIFRARGKYHSKSISDLNKKRRMMLEAKMERIAPSPDVLQKAILLMEKEKQKKSLKASRIDNLKQTPFSRLHSQWFKDKLPVDDDYRRTSLGEQSAIETVMRKSQQKKQVVRNMKLIAKQV